MAYIPGVGFVCTADDMHPYNCDGPKKCIHCDRKRSKHHLVSLCALCNFDTDEEVLLARWNAYESRKKARGDKK